MGVRTSQVTLTRSHSGTCYLSKRKLPQTSVLGIEASPCGLFVLYRRADGNLRLWSGGDNQAPNEPVRRSQQPPSVWFALFGPGIPSLSRGEGQVVTGSHQKQQCAHIEMSAHCTRRLGTFSTEKRHLMLGQVSDRLFVELDTPISDSHVAFAAS